MSLTYEERVDFTNDAFDDPHPGDRFHEMYTWWFYVVWREGNLVACLEAAAPCTFPDDARLWVGTVEDLQERHAYSTPVLDFSGGRARYAVLLAGRGHDVSGWIERATA